MSKIRQIIKKAFPKFLIYWFYANARRSYSQAGQDFWVYGEVFNKKKRGLFVEIGSADGITYNNTFILESKFKWSGICIEANSSLYNMLIGLRKVPCIKACIDENEHNVLFKNSAYASGIVFDPSNNINRNVNDVIEIKTETLESIFKKYKIPFVIDYMSIDIEGAEWRALRNFPFNQYRFNCITIERPSPELRILLRGEGYIAIKEIPYLDVFYIHNSYLETYLMNLYKFWGIKKNK